MKIEIDIPDNMDLRNYNIPYDILNIITNGTPLDNQSKHDEAIHAQGFVDGVKACIEKLNEMGE